MKKVLLLSDIHGNIAALSAVLCDSQKSFSKIDSIWILGDFIDYGVHNYEVLSEFAKLKSKNKDIRYVLGNHEDLLLRGEESYYHPRKEYSKVSSSITRNLLPPTILEYYLKNINENDFNNRYYSLFNRTTYAIHDENKIMSSKLDELLKGGEIILVGHNHLPYRKIITINGKEVNLINPGSVGQPRNGSPCASYAVLTYDDDDQLESVSFKQVNYDIKSESDAIKMAGGNEFIYNRLYLGV